MSQDAPDADDEDAVDLDAVRQTLSDPVNDEPIPWESVKVQHSDLFDRPPPAFTEGVVAQLYCVTHDRETEMHDGRWVCPVCHAAGTN